MFGNTKNEPRNKSNGVISTPSTTTSNSLVQGTNIEGTVHAEKDIRIDGTMTGTLICKGKLIIGPTGMIKGDVQCENAVIEGRFEGVLMVGEILHVKETAKIEGDIMTQKLIVQPGSLFNVKCKMGPPSATPRNTELDEELIDLHSLGNSKVTMS
ncbi:MAG TPA: polymer-forming cytoskeletal protein [Saprospiraceae bacterium]|nr:polymer-forming cytoskeletal protein [Saprospiraceae bacterium]